MATSDATAPFPFVTSRPQGLVHVDHGERRIRDPVGKDLATVTNGWHATVVPRGGWRPSAATGVCAPLASIVQSTRPHEEAAHR